MTGQIIGQIIFGSRPTELTKNIAQLTAGMVRHKAIRNENNPYEVEGKRSSPPVYQLAKRSILSTQSSQFREY